MRDHAKARRFGVLNLKRVAVFGPAVATFESANGGPISGFLQTIFLPKIGGDSCSTIRLKRLPLPCLYPHYCAKQYLKAQVCRNLHFDKNLGNPRRCCVRYLFGQTLINNTSMTLKTAVDDKQSVQKLCG